MAFAGLVVAGAIALFFVVRWQQQSQVVFVRQQCVALASFLNASKHVAGVTYDFAVPSQFTGISHNNKVDFVVNANGRIVILAKSASGYKGNYEGFIYSSTPLLPQDFEPGYGGATTLNMFGDAPNPFVRSKLDSQFCEVFFDLG